MSAVVSVSSDGAACTRQTELVTPDSQSHISSTNQYMLPTHAVKQVTAYIYTLIIARTYQHVYSPNKAVRETDRQIIYSRNNTVKRTTIRQ